MSFHASVTSVHDAVFSSDLKALAALKPELIPPFLHVVMDELCGRFARYEKFQESLQCRPQDIQRLKNGYKLFITQALGRGLKSEQIMYVVVVVVFLFCSSYADTRFLFCREDLKTAGLPDAIVGDREKGVAAMIVSRHEEIRSSLGSAPHCAPYLKDFDWKLNLTVASNQIATLKTPTVLLSLNIDKPQTDNELAEQTASKHQSNHVIELNQADLQKMITQLESMTSAMSNVTL